MQEQSQRRERERGNTCIVRAGQSRKWHDGWWSLGGWAGKGAWWAQTRGVLDFASRLEICGSSLFGPHAAAAMARSRWFDGLKSAEMMNRLGDFISVVDFRIQLNHFGRALSKISYSDTTNSCGVVRFPTWPALRNLF